MGIVLGPHAQKKEEINKTIIIWPDFIRIRF